MQCVADAIVAMLAKKGIIAHMYLDDLIVVAEGYAVVSHQYDALRSVLDEQGLPKATVKSQPPSQQVHWLGINVDVCSPSLSILHVISVVDKHVARRSLSKKQLQSVACCSTSPSVYGQPAYLCLVYWMP